MASEGFRWPRTRSCIARVVSLWDDCLRPPKSVRGSLKRPAASRPRGGSLLSLVGLRKDFGDVTAVHAFELQIEQGEFITLLGPSGCGKTTLLRMIAGFEQPTEGRLLLAGKDITGFPPEHRPFNMVFQSYALFPHMSVFDNVAYGLRTTGTSEREVAERVGSALAMVGMRDKVAVNVRALSGGQQQRVALMRAIVNEPEVLLLDEPLGALDLKLRKRMQDELRSIQHSVGTTFIYVTHDQEEALVMSHRVVLMQSGRIVQVGSPGEVYQRPKTRFVAEFVGETNLQPCFVEAATASEAVAKFEANGLEREFAYFGDTALGPGDQAMVALRPEHLQLVGDEGGDFSGVHVETILLGPTSVHEVRLDDGTLMRVRARERDNARPGDRVGIAILPGRGVVVRAEESAIATT